MAEVSSDSCSNLKKLNPEEPPGKAVNAVSILRRNKWWAFKEPYDYERCKTWGHIGLKVSEQKTSCFDEISTSAVLKFFFCDDKRFLNKGSNHQENCSWKNMSKDNKYFNVAPNS